jgi:hypothetical protein
MTTPTHEWECGSWNCRGYLRTDVARPAETTVVTCEPRPGQPYASSCSSSMRWNGGQERFVPYPDGGPLPSQDVDDWAGGTG